MFGVAIRVYEQDAERTTDLLFRSTMDCDQPLNLNLYMEHFSFVKDLDIYSQSYRCSKCDKLWTSSGNFHRHYRTCDTGVKHVYRSGPFELRLTMFEELENVGINVPKELRIFPFRATWDIECMLKEDLDGVLDTEKVSYSSVHELVSVSICSNVPGYKRPRCFVLDKEDNQKELVKTFLAYLNEISDKSTAIVNELFEPYYSQIVDPKLQQKFEQYMMQLPVISFNGARYDLRVLKTHLIPVLVESDAVRFVIKKGTSYMTISTDELKFLDAVYYVAPGYSLSKFILAYGGSQTKGYFPYHWLTGLEKLKETNFPSYDQFFSNIKQANCLEPKEDDPLSTSEKELISRAPTTQNPLTEAETRVIGGVRYSEIKLMFEEKKWTMQEYLVHYNDLDVVPFLEALNNLSKYYEDRGVDLFKESVSGTCFTSSIVWLVRT